MIRNPLGSTHPEATLKACLEHGAPDDAVEAAKAEFHAQLASKRGQQTDLVEDSELLSEDRELDGDNQGNLSELSQKLVWYLVQNLQKLLFPKCTVKLAFIVKIHLRISMKISRN